MTTTLDPSDPPDTSTSTSTTTTVPVGPIRTVTATEPLTVYVAGDSQAEYLGQAIATESGDRALEVEVEDRISTSLARPDYFNWPAEIAATRDRLDPELVVLFIGANDHQDMADADGNRLVEGTPEWQAEWADRLELSLDLLEADHRHVLWVTQPPMRDSEVDEGIEMINAGSRLPSSPPGPGCRRSRSGSSSAARPGTPSGSPTRMVGRPAPV